MRQITIVPPLLPDLCLGNGRGARFARPDLEALCMVARSISRTPWSSRLALVWCSALWGCSSLQSRPWGPLEMRKTAKPPTTANPGAANVPATANAKPWSERPGKGRDFLMNLTGRQAQPDRARSEFAQAEAKFTTATGMQGAARQTAFEEAGDLYSDAAKHWAGSVLAEDALWMAGESYFFADRYPKAVRSYAGLIKQRPSTRYLDRVDQRRFAIAKYWLSQITATGDSVIVPNISDKERPTTDTFGQAVALLDRIRFDNPAGKLADDATMAAAVAHFERGNHADADVLFTDLRENFGNSEHQFQAYFLGLKSKREIYQGVEYDGSALDEAEKIVKDMVRLFPERASEHREYLEDALKDIRLKQAARDYALAQYYDNHEAFGAARLYYDQVRREFSDTNLALESDGRLAEIKSEPDQPEQSLKWLAELFPEEAPAKPLLQSDNLEKVRK